MKKKGGIWSTFMALETGKIIINDFKRSLTPEQLKEFEESPINGCKCGFIKKGDYTCCPYCEKEVIEND